MVVLVIDDDPAMTELFKLLLKPVTAQVITVNSGPEGIHMAATCDPDVVILDLMMPEMDGWEVCSEIRKTNSVPILILSALDTPGLVAKALDAGADDYLIKPITSGVLIAHLNTLLRRVRLEQPVFALNPAS